MDRRQAIVVEWVALSIIFDVCARYTGYEGGWRIKVTRWKQESEENQLKVAEGIFRSDFGSRKCVAATVIQQAWR